jgi:hypothetical protein
MLYDFVYYEKHSGRITGRFRTSTPELLPKPPSPAHDQVLVTDKEYLELLSSFNSARDVLDGKIRDGKIATLDVKPRYHGQVELKTALVDLDGDGIPELPADGVATAHMTAQFVDHEGNALKPKGTRVSFRVTRGALSSRAIEIVNGRAEVDWKSPVETVQARITASAEGYQESTFALEFIPPDEYRALSSKRKK